MNVTAQPRRRNIVATQVFPTPHHQIAVKGRVELRRKIIVSRSAEMSVFPGHMPVVPDKAFGMHVQRIGKIRVEFRSQLVGMKKEFIDR